ncbi:MAG TPA: phosphate ABC transporter substrate-binding protein PstS [Candidatus Limnocylindrales bacterium]|nr:phosphate ABC transporter substrate-binding protein PstS [Candidatus Limnocylindrales bacterium]
MRIPRTARLGACILAASTIAAACGGGATPAPTTAAGTGAPGTGVPASQGASTPQIPSGNVSLGGAGATFPGLLYQVWIEKFGEAHSNVAIDYQAIGSGGGIKAITQQTVDFGASDAAMKDEEVAALPAGTKILHIPTALGAVVVIFNVKGVDGNPITKLNLDGDTIGGIFLGTITAWNDPKIAALNADIAANLPATPIKVIHRSDGSGTTNAFTTYLNTASQEWIASGVGAGKEVAWKTGDGAPGNDGVSGGVKGGDGRIGYVELQYAVVSGLSSAAIKNADGKFVQGSSAGVTAAAEGAISSFPADFRAAPIINGAGADTYPIAAYTYLLVYVDQKDASKGQALVAFIYWALTDGQNEEKAIGYAPLPEPIRQKAVDELHQITTGGSAIWP